MNKTRHLKCQAPKRDDYKQERKYTNDVCYGKLGSTIIRTIEIHNCSFVASSYICHSLKKTPTQMDAHQIFVIFCMPPHFLACKLYTRKVRKFATTNCLATKQRKSILGLFAVLVGVLAVLVGVLAILVGILGVFALGWCIGYMRSSIQNLGWCIWYFH